MTSHFDSLIRVSVVLGFALLAMPLLQRRSAIARRLVLSVAFVAALVIPFVPAWHVDAPVYRELVARVVSEPSALAVHAPSGASVALRVASSSATPWLALAWGIGALLVAVRFVIGAALSRRLVNRAAPLPAAWDVAIGRAERQTGLRAVVRVSSEIEAPAVTGILSPVILVPEWSAWWTDERKVAVLLHELAHVAAHDLVVQWLSAIACSMHWFNPLAWLAARRLRLERELAADETVLRSGLRASSYAADLLAIAGAAPRGATAMIAIGEQPIATRIAAIVAERRPVVLGKKSAAALVAGTATLALAVACTTTATTAPSAEPSTHASPAAPANASRSVDHELQALADLELARAVSTWKASGGTILVLSPKGEVLAEAGGHADRTYVAGSTMKSFVLAAALDEGVVTESDVFDCGNGERSGKVMYDASPLGRVALPELIAASSNIGFAQIFDRLGGARLDHALRAFDFVTPPDLASARAGDWNGGVTAIGARMSTTPRHVALGYAALANGGNGIVKPGTAARVSTLLEGVVMSERGTGKKARVPGVRVAGKTGTSDWTSESGAKQTYASFVGIVPADHPRYVIFVGIESPAGEEAWGGEVAAPVFARIATSALAR